MHKKYVYIFACEKHMKVGVTSNIQKRLKDISACNPFDVVLIDSFEFNDGVLAYIAEKHVHEELKKQGFHKKNEWFCLCDESIKVVIECMQNTELKNNTETMIEIQSIKEIIKETKGISIKSVAEKVMQAGFFEGAKALQRSFYGDRCRSQIEEGALDEMIDIIIDLSEGKHA